MNKKLALAATALLLGVALMGCTTTEKGAIAGGAIGAGTGAIIGHQTGRGGEGALIGGAVGAVSGGLIGHEIDKSREQQQPPASYSATPPPAPPASSTGQYSGGGDYYEGERDTQGRKWVPEHYEYRTYTATDGSTYQKQVLVPGHYE
ncbi:glycine zipper 2TM domain-containing protein [Candidatus Poribacteria bacterium]|nr:glycine zipper 2TM domain-containing protein [Candidatus Poribacteria bacterium]